MPGKEPSHRRARTTRRRVGATCRGDRTPVEAGFDTPTNTMVIGLIVQVRRDHVGVDLLGLRAQVIAVSVEVFRVVYARRVPVDQYGVLVPLDALGDHLVVRILPGAGNPHVDEDDLIHAGENAHDLVELLPGEGAIVAEMNYHQTPELPRRAAGLEDVYGIVDLQPDFGIDDPETSYVLLKTRNGAEHHRIADGADGAGVSGSAGTPVLRGLGSLRFFPPGILVLHLLARPLFGVGILSFRLSRVLGRVDFGLRGGRPVFGLSGGVDRLHLGQVFGLLRWFGVDHGHA